MTDNLADQVAKIAERWIYQTAHHGPEHLCNGIAGDVVALYAATLERVERERAQEDQVVVDLAAQRNAAEAQVERVERERDEWETRAHGYELRLGALGRDLNAAEAQVERERDEAREYAEGVELQLHDANVAVEALRKALEPFAKASDLVALHHLPPQHLGLSRNRSFTLAPLETADLHRARAALAALSAPAEESSVDAPWRAALGHADACDWQYLQGLLAGSVRHSEDHETRFWMRAIRRLRAAYEAPLPAPAEARSGQAADERHAYTPHARFPWFCDVCGYAEHERLQHLPTPPKAEAE